VVVGVTVVPLDELSSDPQPAHARIDDTTNKHIITTRKRYISIASRLLPSKLPNGKEELHNHEAFAFMATVAFLP